MTQLKKLTTDFVFTPKLTKIKECVRDGRKDEILKAISLTEIQMHMLNANDYKYMELEDAAVAGGVSESDVILWEQDPFVRVCWQVKYECDDDDFNFIRLLDTIKAGFLVSVGMAWKDIEDMLGMRSGEISALYHEDKYLHDHENVDDDFDFRAVVFDVAKESLATVSRALIRESLPDRQRQAVPLILSGKTDREVGEAVGVTRETVCEWRSKREFKTVLNRERERVWVENRHMVDVLNKKALVRLYNLIDSDDERIALHASLGTLKALASVALPDDPREESW